MSFHGISLAHAARDLLRRTLNGDLAAAIELARMTGQPTFPGFVKALPGLHGKMTPETFDLLAQAHDIWRLESIPVPEPWVVDLS